MATSAVDLGCCRDLCHNQTYGGKDHWQVSLSRLYILLCSARGFHNDWLLVMVELDKQKVSVTLRQTVWTGQWKSVITRVCFKQGIVTRLFSRIFGPIKKTLGMAELPRAGPAPVHGYDWPRSASSDWSNTRTKSPTPMILIYTEEDLRCSETVIGWNKIWMGSN
jgi:hypothetical protein